MWYSSLQELKGSNRDVALPTVVSPQSQNEQAGPHLHYIARSSRREGTRIFTMVHTIIVDFATFERDVLGLGPSDLVNLAALPEKLITDAQSMLGYIFHHEVLRKEEDIAMQFVRSLDDNVDVLRIDSSRP
ncbi:hypothetical protein NUW54_g6975 [Trametes sanguinea]|uniref:Uncharacterized protein n=1 Tax=Trametes sanguinea TaxID=158606 RepID=A0ACC1PQD1_9APHY|nr:hypothetical protein NUW54_g6975 [Trametes sanguinea]